MRIFYQPPWPEENEWSEKRKQSSSGQTEFHTWDPDSQDQFATLLDTAGQFFRLQGQISNLQDRVDSLEEAARDGHEPCTIFSSSLGSEAVEVKKSIPISIACDGEEFVATWYDANISAGGDTANEAISRLHSLILEIFDDLESRQNDSLGKSMKKQKNVLLESLCRIS